MKRRVLIVFVFILTSMAGAQMVPASGEVRPSVKLDGRDGWAAVISRGEYKGEPAFVFPIHHYKHLGFCKGFLYVTPTRVAYDPSLSPKYADHAFEVPRAEFRVYSFKGLEFGAGEKRYSFTVIWKQGQRLESALMNSTDDYAPESVRIEYARFIELAARDFAAADKMFQAALAGTPAPAVPAAQVTPVEPVADKPRPAAVARLPVIAILDPADVADGKTIEATSKSLVIYGTVTHESGIAAVTVNGREVTLNKLGPSTYEFEAPPLQLRAGVMAVVVAAIATDKSQAQVAFRVHPPARTGPPPLTLDELEQSLKEGVPKSRLMELIGQYKVDFVLNDEIEKRLRSLGADADLLLAIAKSRP